MFGQPVEFPADVELAISEEVARLDAILCGGVQAKEASRKRLARGLHPGHLDQMAAAQRHGRAVVSGGIPGQGHIDEFVMTDAAAQPDWLRRVVLDTIVVWSRNAALTCTHQPTVLRPQPSFAATWRRRTVVCAQCVPLLGLPSPVSSIKPCDNCTRLWPEVIAEGGVALKVVQVSCLMVSYAVCDQCRHVV